MKIDTVTLDGEPYARGRAFGKERRKKIQSWLRAWQKSLEGAGIIDPEAYLAGMLHETDFVSAITEITPDLLDEVKGMAEGAGQPLSLMLAAQFLDEEWAYRSNFVRQQDHLEKCTSLAIASERGTTWIGQNMDLGAYTDHHQVLMCRGADASSPGALVFSVGAMIGLMGVNDNGVGVCVNSLPQLPSRSTGLPVAFVVRKALSARSASEAAGVIQSVPHATAQHYLVADANEIFSYEASPAAVIKYIPPNPSRIFHTNHPLALDVSHAFENATVNSIARLCSIESRLSSGDVDLIAVKAALASADDRNHPVSRPRPPKIADASLTNFTTGSMISVLSRGAPTIETWVSAGPPRSRDYTEFHLSSASVA